MLTAQYGVKLKADYLPIPNKDKPSNNKAPIDMSVIARQQKKRMWIHALTPRRVPLIRKDKAINALLSVRALKREIMLLNTDIECLSDNDLGTMTH